MKHLKKKSLNQIPQTFDYKHEANLANARKTQYQLKNEDMSVDRQESTDSAVPILFRNLVGVQFMSSLTYQLVKNSKQDTDGCRDVMFELTKQHGARTFLSNRRSFYLLILLLVSRVAKTHQVSKNSILPSENN